MTQFEKRSLDCAGIVRDFAECAKHTGLRGFRAIAKFQGECIMHQVNDVDIELSQTHQTSIFADDTNVGITCNN